jgi:hypothetical protein
MRQPPRANGLPVADPSQGSLPWDCGHRWADDNGLDRHPSAPQRCF